MYEYDYSKLRGKIAEKVGTLTSFTEKMQISEPSLYSKINNKTEFKQSEIVKACEILEIPIDIVKEYFFCIK